MIDGIPHYVRYDWKNLSNDARNIRLVSAYRRMREVYRKIKPFITGDHLSQQNEAEATKPIARI